MAQNMHRWYTTHLESGHATHPHPMFLATYTIPSINLFQTPGVFPWIDAIS